MEKYYTRIEWENEPSTSTPLDEDNLNLMDAAIDELDDRIVEHDSEITTLQGYETRASQAASEAESSATAAATSEDNAKDYMDDAHGWCDNKGDSGGASYSSTNNAYYYAMEASNSASQASTDADSCNDAVDQITTLVNVATFSVDTNGDLIYTDNTAYTFTVDNNGYLNWEVTA